MNRQTGLNYPLKESSDRNLGSTHQNRAYLRIVFIVSIMASLLTNIGYAQSDNSSRLYGVITGTEGPIEGALVFLSSEPDDPNPLELQFTTGSDGGYEFSELTQKKYLISVTYNEINHSKSLSLSNSSTVEDFVFTGELAVHPVLEDGSPVEGLEIRLYNSLYLNEKNATTDSSGVAFFDSLNINSEYLVSFSYQRIPYSKVLALNKTGVTRVDVDVLPSTTSDEGFYIYNHHVVITSDGTALRTWEQAAFYNLGDKVFNTSWLKGWIPSDATDITHDTMECCFQLTGEGYYAFDPMDPLFPGDNFALELSYNQDIKVPNQVIEKKVIYDTSSMFFLIEEQEKVSVEALQNVEYDGIETFGDRRYLRFLANDLSAGDMVSLEMKTDVSVLDMISSNSLIWGPVILGLPVGLAYVYINRKDEFRENLREEQASIFESLAKAEKDLKNNMITGDEFESIREQYKKRSIEIIKKLDKPKPEPDPEHKHVGQPIDLISELKAVEAVINRINDDYEEGNLSEDSYLAIYTKYEAKRIQLINRISEFAEKADSGGSR